ncbi:N4-gp56 family major capsid protein [Uliginosibacterium gangwonense]|uniref:N4-gp56 family major capsid protein n=1 Tax=Uliginosibacterium gangwonense TaxID=392736 RepID=UPI00035EC8EB|nr:N4-gp56 family major capsid protein [Uliginosibacterium gangwonense]
MAQTNFALLTNEQKTVWSLDFWRQARNLSYVNKFLGKDANSLIQHITELKKTEKGARAVITLLADLEGDGVVGDRTLEGNEEVLKSYDQVIQIDQLRNANRHEGRMADQRSVVNFRENSRDKLAYWLSDRIDQLAFLTLAGKAYSYATNGKTRIGSDLKNLEFAKDVTPPSAKRIFRWNNASKLIEQGGGSNTVAAADTPSWELFVQLKAYAKENYMRGIMADGGEETFHAFLSPMAMSRLKLDPTYIANLRYAQQRGAQNELFTGSSVKIDGIYLHEFRHVPNTRLAPAGSKFGSTGTVDGCQVLFCGAQALGMADIGNPEWVEKEFDYDNQPGISVGKILGFLKPQFTTQYSDGTKEDHGVISAFVAQ